MQKADSRLVGWEHMRRRKNCLSSIASKNVRVNELKVKGQTNQESRRHASTRLARITLTSFFSTFLAARIVVYLIISQRIPDLFLYIGGTHIHHLNFGILLLSGVGSVLLFTRPVGRALYLTGGAYGAGLALTYDEFGMWLHLGGSYWQRASFDAIGIIASGLALIAYSPPVRLLRLRHLVVAALLGGALLVLGSLTVERIQRLGNDAMNRFEHGDTGSTR